MNIRKTTSVSVLVELDDILKVIGDFRAGDEFLVEHAIVAGLRGLIRTGGFEKIQAYWSEIEIGETEPRNKHMMAITEILKDAAKKINEVP